MLHVEDIREGMIVVGSDGKTIGKANSLSGQMLKIVGDGSAHFLDIGLVASVDRAANEIQLLVTSPEARERWSDEGGDIE
jgi:hypothetical protein